MTKGLIVFRSIVSFSKLADSERIAKVTVERDLLKMGLEQLTTKISGKITMAHNS